MLGIINLKYSSYNIVHKLLEYLETDKTISLDVFKKSVQSFKNMGFFIDGRQNGNTPLLANLFKTSFCTDSEAKNLYIEVANTMIELGSNINAIGNLNMSVYDFVAKIEDSEDATLLFD